jgi:hypothetical protein
LIQTARLLRPVAQHIPGFADIYLVIPHQFASHRLARQFAQHGLRQEKNESAERLGGYWEESRLTPHAPTYFFDHFAGRLRLAVSYQKNKLGRVGNFKRQLDRLQQGFSRKLATSIHPDGTEWQRDAPAHQ